MNKITMDKIIKLSPLTETTFYILISLINPLHGYGIMQKVQKLSEGRIRLAPGTLYGALTNLVQTGLIVPEESGSSNPRRKIYRITETGKKLADYEIKRLQEMIINGKMLLEGKVV